MAYIQAGAGTLSDWAARQWAPLIDSHDGNPPITLEEPMAVPGVEQVWGTHEAYIRQQAHTVAIFKPVFSAGTPPPDLPVNRYVQNFPQTYVDVAQQLRPWQPFNAAAVTAPAPTYVQALPQTYVDQTGFVTKALQTFTAPPLQKPIIVGPQPYTDPPSSIFKRGDFTVGPLQKTIVVGPQAFVDVPNKIFPAVQSFTAPPLQKPTIVGPQPYVDVPSQITRAVQSYTAPPLPQRVQTDPQAYTDVGARFIPSLVTQPVAPSNAVQLYTLVGPQPYTDVPSQFWPRMDFNAPPVTAPAPTFITVPQQAYVDAPSAFFKRGEFTAMPLQRPVIVGPQPYTDAPSNLWKSAPPITAFPQRTIIVGPQAYTDTPSGLWLPPPPLPPISATPQQRLSVGQQAYVDVPSKLFPSLITEPPPSVFIVPPMIVVGPQYDQALRRESTIWGQSVVLYQCQLTNEESTMLKEIWQLLGLDRSNPVSITTVQTLVDRINLLRTGDGVSAENLARVGGALTITGRPSILQPSQRVMLTEIWTILGLDTLNPMTVTPSAQDAGAIHFDLSGNGVDSTTITRT